MNAKLGSATLMIDGKVVAEITSGSFKTVTTAFGVLKVGRVGAAQRLTLACHAIWPAIAQRVPGGWVVVNREGRYGVCPPGSRRGRSTENYDEATRFSRRTIETSTRRQAVAWDDKLRPTEYVLGYQARTP